VKKNLCALCFFIGFTSLPALAFVEDTASRNGNTHSDLILEMNESFHGAVPSEQPVHFGAENNAPYYDRAEAYVSIPDSATSELTTELEF
jgi:hypothetical protein